MGIGKGTLAVCVAIVIGVIICFLRNISATPTINIFIGIALPLLVLGILWILPKESLDEDEVDLGPTDPYLVKTITGTVVIVLSCICISIIWCGLKFIHFVYAHRVDSEIAKLKKFSHANTL